jgi:hypothetical protein
MTRLALALVMAAAPVAAADVCHEISATAGWQAGAFPEGLVQVLYAQGFWTTRAGELGPVGTRGHGGDAGKMLFDEGAARIDPNAGHGALLVRFEIAGETRMMPWSRLLAFTEQSGAFNMNLDRMEFRINEGDDLLDDNDGAITVCLRYVD